MKHNNFVIQPPHKPRKPDGATMGLVICCIFVFISIGTALFYIIQSVVGDREIANGTDAGALAAARALLGVSLKKDQATHIGINGPYKGIPDTIPQQFKITAFDKNGNPATSIDANGNPANSINGSIRSMVWGTDNPPYYTMNSYNEACGIVAVACLRAAQGGAGAANAAAITNANNLCNICLNNFAADLSVDQLTTAETATAFTNVAGNNIPNVLPVKFFGSKPATTMVPNTLDLGCVVTSGFSSNVYLPSGYTVGLLADTPEAQVWLKSLQSGTQANAPGVNGSAAPFLLAGGVNIDTSTWKDANGTLLNLQAKFCLIPFDTNQVTHLTDPPKQDVVEGGFKATLPNGSSITGTYTIAANGQNYFSSPNAAGMNALLATAGDGQSVTVTNPFSNNSWSFSVNGPGSGAYANQASITPNSPAPGQPPGTLYNHFTPPSYTGAGIPPFAPYNVVRVAGQAQEEAANNQTPASMTVLSAAAADTNQQYQVAVPHGYVRIMNGPDFVTAMNAAGHSAATEQNTVSFLTGSKPNSSDFWFSNVELEPNNGSPGSTTIPLSYNGAVTMFNVFSFENNTGDGRDWVTVGVDNSDPNFPQGTGVYNLYKKFLHGQNSDAAKLGAWSKAGSEAPPNGIPQKNYNSVVDDPYLDANPGNNQFNKSDPNPPSMPFNWDTETLYGSTQTTPIDTIDAFTGWIEYNRARAAGRQGVDPLQGSLLLQKARVANSVELGKKYPNCEVINTGGGPIDTLRATSSPAIQHMTISDALAINDILIISDSAYILTTEHPQWVDAILPICAANYKVDYLPPPNGGTKTSLTATEYAKGQIICLYAGEGMTILPTDPQHLPPHSGEAHGDVLPSHPGAVYLPMEAVTDAFPNRLNPSSTICSGMKDFVGPPSTGFGAWPPGNPASDPYSGNIDKTIQGNNKNLLVHRDWVGDPNAASVAQFEQVATPIQLLYGTNVLCNFGKFNNGDVTFGVIMNGLLKAMQTINPGGNYKMQDLVNALNSAPVDNPKQPFDLLAVADAPANPTPSGTIYYLSSNINTGLLQISTVPPAGDSLIAADGAPVQYWATYEVAGGFVADNDPNHEAEPQELKTLVDTSYGGPPNGPNKGSLPGWKASLGPFGPGADLGDANIHETPYRSLSQLNIPGGYIYTEDMVQWTPGSAASPNSTNLGDLQFYESVGPSMQFSSIN